MAGQFDRIVQPGESGKIPIKVSTHKGSGPLSKSITVNTNIPGKDSTLRLVIKGEVWQPVQVTPPSAAFGRITSDQASAKSQRKLTIINNIGGNLNPSNIRVSNNHFKAETRPLEAGKKYELIVSLVPPLKDGNNTGKITISTGLDNPATIDVPVYAYLTSPVDVTPTQLTLLSGRTSAMKRQFYVRSHDNKAFEISDLTSKSGELKLSVSDLRGSKKTYQIVADIPADYTPPPGGDQITFKTTHPAQPTMSIPVVQRGARGVRRGMRQRRPAAHGTRKFTGKGIQAKPAKANPKQANPKKKGAQSGANKPAQLREPQKMTNAPKDK